MLIKACHAAMLQHNVHHRSHVFCASSSLLQRSSGLERGKYDLQIVCEIKNTVSFLSSLNSRQEK